MDGGFHECSMNPLYWLFQILFMSVTYKSRFIDPLGNCFFQVPISIKKIAVSFSTILVFNSCFVPFAHKKDFGNNKYITCLNLREILLKDENNILIWNY